MAARGVLAGVPGFAASAQGRTRRPAAGRLQRNQHRRGPRRLPRRAEPGALAHEQRGPPHPGRTRRRRSRRRPLPATRALANPRGADLRHRARGISPASISMRQSLSRRASAGWSARARSACPACPSRRRCAITSSLSQKNYAIDMGPYPLGSCTMKHNPRLNEKMARLPGFADVHPLQPVSTVQGALALMEELAYWLLKLTNMQAVALSPKAGRAWRNVRHDGDQGRHRRTGRRRDPQGRAGAGIGARHQSRHRRRAGLFRARDSRRSGRAGPSGSRRRRARPRCRGDHADQSQHLRTVRARHRRDRPAGP